VKYSQGGFLFAWFFFIDRHHQKTFHRKVLLPDYLYGVSVKGA
jgi:hypothetical protein